MTPKDYNAQSQLVTLPNDLAINLVAGCEKKNILRQTCKYFCEFASRIKNENILKQSQLNLNQEALNRYFLYYGALGNTVIVRNLLAKGANPNACEDNGRTLMYHAMRCGYNDIAKQLLQHSNLSDEDKSLFLSSTNKTSTNKKRLVRYIFSSREEALNFAVYNGLYTKVRDLLIWGKVSANGWKERLSPLHHAISEQYIHIMELLLKHGAYVNGYKHGAYVNGYKHGAYVNGYKHGAYVNGYKENSPLGLAISGGGTIAVQLLIDYGAKVKGKYEDTLLHEALRLGYSQIIKMLIEMGANVNARGDDFEECRCIVQ